MREVRTRVLVSVFLERNLEMTRKLASYALLAAVVGMFVETSDAEARHCQHRRHRCCQTSNYGYGYGNTGYSNVGYQQGAGCSCR